MGFHVYGAGVIASHVVIKGNNNYRIQIFKIVIKSKFNEY